MRQHVLYVQLVSIRYCTRLVLTDDFLLFWQARAGMHIARRDGVYNLQQDSSLETIY